MNEHGHTLIETLAALGLTAIAALSGLQGSRALAGAMQTGVARETALRVLSEARLQAYTTGRIATVFVPRGSRTLVLEAADGASRTVALPTPFRIVASPRSERVSFRPTGLASNATIEIADGRGAACKPIIVNQRGLIR